MDDLDLLLELQLRRLLDPIVAARVPVRRTHMDLRPAGYAPGLRGLMPAPQMVAVPVKVRFQAF
jgi:hypothetical protein